MRRGRRRRVKGLLTRLGRNLWKRRWVRRACWLTVAFVVGVNLSVSYIGRSDTFFLSPFHLFDKTRALGFYAAHQLRRLGGTEMPSPEKALQRSARKHNVPRKLAFAIAKAESDFIPHRISPTGAMGVMQLMPDTAMDLGIRDPFHTGENADGGVRYLAKLWKRYRGDLRRIAAAYNAGPGNVPRIGAYQVPRETRRYVSRVIRYTRIY
jgi:soluble lytic murein transglycosylase-like protein